MAFGGPLGLEMSWQVETAQFYMKSLRESQKQEQDALGHSKEPYRAIGPRTRSIRRKQQEPTTGFEGRTVENV